MKPTVRGTGVDPAQFFTASRLVIVAGKGGVGKTTVSATLARAAARSGLSSLIIEVEGKSGLAAMFGRPAFSYDEVTLAEADEAAGRAPVRARTLTPDDALLEYLEDSGMSRISKRLMTSGALDMVSTAIPGIRDILVLGKVKQLERAGLADLLILDAPAAGHAITFLQSASGLADAVPVGPDQHPGQGRARAAGRPGPLPGGAGDPARGDAGQRAGRDGVPARGPGRRQPRAGRGQRLLPAAPRPRRRPGRRRPTAAGASLRPGEAEALAEAAVVPPRAHGAAGRAGRPAGRRPAAPPAARCPTCSTPSSAPPSSTCWPTPMLGGRR